MNLNLSKLTIIQLDHFEYGLTYQLRVNKGLVECLRSNTDLFEISLYEMIGIDLSIACHKLNIDPGARWMF